MNFCVNKANMLSTSNAAERFAQTESKIILNERRSITGKVVRLSGSIVNKLDYDRSMNSVCGNITKRC